MEYTAFLTPSIGAAGLLTLVILMILRGSLVTRKILDDMRADKDKQIDTWKAAYETALAVQEVQRQQITALLDATRATTQVIQAIPKAAGLNEGNGRHVLAEAEE